MMKTIYVTFTVLLAVAFLAGQANADLVSVSGPTSSRGVLPEILVSPPAHALDDITTNNGMQGFNEAQGVVTSIAHGIDGGGSIAAGRSSTAT